MSRVPSHSWSISQRVTNSTDCQKLVCTGCMKSSLPFYKHISVSVDRVNIPAATVWWCHVNIGQNLWRILPALCWGYISKIESRSEGRSVHDVPLELFSPLPDSLEILNPVPQPHPMPSSFIHSGWGISEHYLKSCELTLDQQTVFG